MTSSASPRAGGRTARIHTPCEVGDIPLPDRCMIPGHVKQGEVDDRLVGRCRVVELAPGGHLWFGAEKPVGVDNWLQVGRVAPRLPSAVSKVVGRIWFTHQSQGARVLVENVSSNNILELRASRLPRPLTLYPAARADPDDVRSELLGTPMVAVQTPSTTLTISNKSTDFLVWIEAPIWALRANVSAFTADPRAPLSPKELAELDDAALRIQLADPENHPLLRRFLDDARVREQLRGSGSLQAFVQARGIAAKGELAPWQVWAENEVENVNRRTPTHEIHRLILEGIGRPPIWKTSKTYTNLVADHLDPDRPLREGRPGGVGGGLGDLVPVVKGLWAFKQYQLERYLGLPPAAG